MDQVVLVFFLITKNASLMILGRVRYLWKLTIACFSRVGQELTIELGHYENEWVVGRSIFPSRKGDPRGYCAAVIPQGKAVSIHRCVAPLLTWCDFQVSLQPCLYNSTPARARLDRRTPPPPPPPTILPPVQDSPKQATVLQPRLYLGLQQETQLSTVIIWLLPDAKALLTFVLGRLPTQLGSHQRPFLLQFD